MTKGGLIMDVINAEQAKVAEAAGVSILQTCHVLVRVLNIWTIGVLTRTLQMLNN